METNMIFRSLVVIFLTVFCGACHSEPKAKNKSIDLSFEKVVTAFSNSVSTGSTSKFLDITNSDEVHLVRKFTSGNLGGRGEELNRSVSVSSLNDEMEFPIKDQTPFNLKIIFPGLPVEASKKLPKFNVRDIEGLSFEEWYPELMKALVDAPEAVSGDPVLLVSQKYWIYCEAQIIDGVLAGGFAIFENDADHFSLVSIVDLL